MAGIFQFSVCKAQNQKRIDSLENILPGLPKSKKKIHAFNALAKEMVDVDPDKSMQYALKAAQLAKELNIKSSEAVAYQGIGNAYYNKADYKSSLSYYLKALHLNEQIGNKEGVFSSSGSLGNVYIDLGQLDKALKYMQHTLQIATELNHKRGIASALIAIGTIYSEKGDYNKALSYNFRSLKIFEELDFKEAIATNYNNLADAYHKLKQYPQALEYITKALNLYESLGNVYGTCLALNNTAEFYLSVGDERKAIELYKRSLEMSKTIEANEHMLGSYRGLTKAYTQAGNYEEALKVNELFIQKNDSIYNSETSSQIAEMQARFESEKKAKEIALLTKDKKLREADMNRQTIISWSVITAGVLSFLLAIVAIKGYSQKKKANNELETKNQKIENAYHIIEEQHKDIKDSIKYAKRIQEAILPPDNLIKALLPESFVIYKPKDIVSGDFYWIEKVDSKQLAIDKTELQNADYQLPTILLAAVDCTGHGVPGAFMSIVGHNLLNQAVNEHGKTKPSEILDEVNIGLSESLRQTPEDSNVKDGMDIALCTLNMKTNMLQFAGANNPLWIIRGNELIEIKGNKFPIGIFIGEKLNKFTNHEIQLVKNDSVFLFTDGYADQFGGEKGKKFKYAKLKELLLSMQNKKMTEQKDILNEAFEKWKGDLEQVDDVCVISVRI